MSVSCEKDRDGNANYVLSDVAYDTRRLGEHQDQEVNRYWRTCEVVVKPGEWVCVPSTRRMVANDVGNPSAFDSLCAL